MWEKQKVSCFDAVAKAAKHLHSQHGEVCARKLAASELRKARRARCRKRFIFWELVARNLQSRARRSDLPTIEARLARGRRPPADIEFEREKSPSSVTVPTSP